MVAVVVEVPAEVLVAAVDVVAAAAVGGGGAVAAVVEQQSRTQAKQKVVVGLVFESVANAGDCGCDENCAVECCYWNRLTLNSGR